MISNNFKPHSVQTSLSQSEFFKLEKKTTCTAVAHYYQLLICRTAGLKAKNF